MTTPSEQRRIRLANDYKEMLNVKGPIVEWRVLEGTPPYVEKYELTIHVRTITGPGPNYRDTNVVQVTLPPDYVTNIQSAPKIVMTTKPRPFHPNWFSDGRWCAGAWTISEGLGHLVIRMIHTLQFDPEITNPESAADREAKAWYEANLRRGWFPCDRQVLPDPTTSRFQIETAPKKKFDIQS